IIHTSSPQIFTLSLHDALPISEFALNSQLREALAKDSIIPERVQSLLDEAASMNVTLDTATLEFVVRRQTELQARAFWTNPKELDRKSTRLNSSHLVISYAVFC